MFLLAAALNLFLVALCVIIHYEILRLVSGATAELNLRPRQRLLVVISGAFLAHLLEICLFAATLMLMEYQLNMGSIAGAHSGGWEDFFYFSAASYTTLGMGDITPTGAMRSMVAIESLAGLVLIGWSTSFTYLSMRDFWNQGD